MGDNRKLIILGFNDPYPARSLERISQRLKRDYPEYKFLLINGNVSVFDPEKDGNFTVAKFDGYDVTIDDIIQTIDKIQKKED